MIKRALVGNATGNELFHCDAIEHEGAIWLVTDWLQHPTEGWMTPARIIRLTGLQYQETPGGPLADYIVNEPIPKDVLDGKISTGQAAKYQVIERPDIRIPTGGTH